MLVPAQCARNANHVVLQKTKMIQVKNTKLTSIKQSERNNETSIDDHDRCRRIHGGHVGCGAGWKLWKSLHHRAEREVAEPRGDPEDRHRSWLRDCKVQDQGRLRRGLRARQ